MGYRYALLVDPDWSSVACAEVQATKAPVEVVPADSSPVRQWLKRLGMKAILMRPDRYVSATTNDRGELRQLVRGMTPEEVTAHIQFMGDFATKLEGTGEFVDGQALSPEGTFVRYDGEGRPPVTDGPFAETKDLIAGWMVIDVDSYQRAIELAGELSAAPGAGGRPIHEWLEVRPFLTEPPAVTE